MTPLRTGRRRRRRGPRASRGSDARRAPAAPGRRSSLVTERQGVYLNETLTVLSEKFPIAFEHLHRSRQLFAGVGWPDRLRWARLLKFIVILCFVDDIIERGAILFIAAAATGQRRFAPAPETPRGETFARPASARPLDTAQPGVQLAQPIRPLQAAAARAASPERTEFVGRVRTLIDDMRSIKRANQSVSGRPLSLIQSA